ncbi:GNAT family N-acetyltransferase [Undibacterium sp.]|uniref:GNAT family N-acetyltransferase n=1 Tax=Undibacterium sp. TaxID=1914977 RepID=UPI002CFA715B|nr:GNAT family N-acetyltransferase [Undibacterium sp.]HTD03655.1 GNAT family N-acetyltransferase [Undibacterium sp.]
MHARVQMDIEVRSATPADAAAACEALRRSIAECCREDHRNDEAILAAWLGNKNSGMVAAWFSSAANFALLATYGGEVAGVALLTRGGKIALCHVIPETLFKGAGKELLKGLEQKAVEWHLPWIKVLSTASAREFYLRNGFIPCGDATSAYGTAGYKLIKQLSGPALPEDQLKKLFCGCTAQNQD